MKLWDKHRTGIIGGITIFFVVAVLLVGLRLGWTDNAPPWLGFGEYQPPPGKVEGYQPPKTIWNLLELIIIPLVLVAIAYLFSRSESVKEREIELDRQREETLQAYFDRMTKLLLENNLVESEPTDKVRNVTRIWTLTALRRLDGKRKGLLLQFLFEAGLIERGEPIPDDPRSGLGKRKAIIHLEQADLSDIDLSGALMNSVDLIGANLEGAKLRGVRFSQAVLFEANLRKADLRNANLRGADLRGIDFAEADLRGADLSSSVRDSRTDFTKANLKDTKGIGMKRPL